MKYHEMATIPQFTAGGNREADMATPTLQKFLQYVSMDHNKQHHIKKYRSY